MFSDKIEDYVGQDIIARGDLFINFEGENTKCFMNPLYLNSKESSLWEMIENRTEVFPQKGAIEVDIKDGLTAQDIVKQNGQLFKIRLTVTPHMVMNGEQVNNYYKSSYSRKRGKGSYIVIETISSTSFMQILPCPINFEQLLDSWELPEPDVDIYTEKRILLELNGCYYGPFETKIKEDSSISITALKDLNYCIGKFEKSKFPYQIIDADNIKLIAFTNGMKIKDLLENSLEQYDCISEKELISLLDRVLKNSQKGDTFKTFNRDLRVKINSVLNQTLENRDDPNLSKDRLDRIIGLINNSELQENEKENILAQITYMTLNDQQCREELIKIALKQKPEIIRNAPMVQAEILKEQQKLQNALDEKNLELKQLHDDIKHASHNKEQLEKEIEKEKQKIMDGIQTKNEELLMRKFNLEEEIKEKDIVHRNKIQDIGKVQKELDDLERRYEQKVDEYKRKINEFKYPEKVIEKALDKALLEQSLRIFSGEQSVHQNELPKFNIKLLDNIESESSMIDTGHKMIVEVSEYLKDHRRNLERNDVINLLICITQGFITTFAGEPGTGKTSICYLLAKALGLARTDQNNRFTEVSVERGWASSKDFIGYYNPLTRQFEESNHEVFQAIRILDQEASSLNQESIAEVAPYLILLDEANLSPIEHYWANFLRICDMDSCQHRTLQLGGAKDWRIPEHLRFVATVNFDHTTEELSPRFLDRSWVIILNPQEIDNDLEENEESEKSPVKTIVSYSKLNYLFGSCMDDIDDAILEKWKDIQSIFNKYKMSIAPRNLKMVHNYCVVANRYMDTNTPDTRYAPLDYAVSQKILPIINGIDTRYEKLISDLKKEFGESLPRCTEHLERIETAAKETQYYQFFCR